MSFRILCIEPNPIARLGIELTFQELAYPLPKLVGGLAEAAEHLHREHVDIIVLDVQVDRKLAFRYASELRKVAPDLKFVLWASIENHLLLAQAVVHGFYEVIPRDLSATEFAENILALSRGLRLEGSLVKRFSEYMVRTDWPTMTLASGGAASSGKVKRSKGKSANELATVELTRREMQIIAMLALGLNNNDIGAVLGIRLDTTKEHVQNILRKLALPDRTAVAVWATRHAQSLLEIPSYRAEGLSRTAC